MPYADPDSTDPMELHGVELEIDDPDSIREMAVCFVEEYLRLSISPAQILAMFSNAEYAGPALAVRRLGLDAICAILEQQLVMRGRRSPQTPIERLPGGRVSLPVLEQ